MTNPLFPSTPQSRIPTPGHSRKTSMNATATSPASTSSSNTSGRNFRALRSLLPFAPNKQATPVSPSATLPSQHNGQSSGGGTMIKSPFASFGTVRRSMNLTREKEKGKGRDVERERKMSLASALPVIAIEHPSMSMEVATPIRKSMSLTMLEREKPLPDAPVDEMGQFRRASNDGTLTRGSAVRSPDSEQSSTSGTRSGSSIQPWESENSTEGLTSTVPATADLSTIIEADTSGISKHIPSTTDSSPSLPPSRFPSVSPANSPIHSKRSSPSDSPLLPVQQLPIRPLHPPRSNSGFMPSPSPSPFSPVSSDADADIGNDSSHLELDFSTSQITSQVASALNNAPGSWDDADVVDADESFVLDQHEQEEDHTERRRIGQMDSMIINMDTVDPHLAALLSPHKIPPGHVPSPGLLGDEENNTTIIPKSIRAAGSSSGSVLLPKQPKENSRRPQQQSSLPRLRPKIFTADTGSSSLKHPSSAFQTNAFDSETHTQSHQQGREGLLGSASASTSTLPMTTSSSPASISPTASASAFTPTMKPPSSIASSTQRSASGSTTGRGHMRMLTSPSPSASTTTLDPAFVLRKDSRRQQKDRDSKSHLGIGLGLPSSAGATSSPSDSPQPEDRRSFDSSPRLDTSMGTDSSSPRRFINEHRGRGSLDESFSPRRPSPSPGFSASTPFNIKRQRRRSMSVDDTNTPTRERSGSAISSTRAYLARAEERPGSSLSSGGRTDPWLGPRTAKAFRAAGLLEGKDSSPDTGNILGHLGMQRYGSLRGTRAPPRVALSDAAFSASGRRRGSESYFSPGGSGGSGSLQSPTDSPTLTFHSRERAPSTAPTSVSSHSLREREDEFTAMKEKHATETSALLSALSDSQRTARVLRDENAELRGRIQDLERISDINERLVVENEQLREGLGELEEDNKRLRRVVGELKVQMRLGEMRLSGSLSAGSGITSNGERRLYGSLGRHAGSPLRPRAESPPSPETPPTATQDSFDLSDFKSTSTPAPPRNWRYEEEEDVESTSSPSHVRRYSSASSNFPAPPPEMTMLMQEDHDPQGYASTSSCETGSPIIAIPLSKHHAHKRDTSITSISPTTANFSMISGSPRSLSLRPEHERHLGDMDSLDLGHRSDDDGEEENEDW